MDKNLIPKKKINVKKVITFFVVVTIIMSVLGIGIYFFIKSILTQPDPCGDDGKLTCKLNNACIDTNICDYSTAEYSLQYDPESCNCKIKCNDPNAKGINNDGSGSSSIDMKKHDDGSYAPPNGDVICGIDCPLASANEYQADRGGPGYCKSNYLCGTLTYKDRSHGIYEGQHCFSNIDFIKCSSGAESICPMSSGCNDDGYCKEFPCSGSEEINGSVYEYVYACQSDEECGVSGAECKKDGKFKYFDNWGYCVNNTGGISNKGKKHDYKCGHKRFFGQNKESEFINCQEFNNTSTGVNAKNQCDEKGIFLAKAPKNTCAKYGICSNNWQALDSSGNVGCSASPVPDNSSYNCCADEKKAKSLSGDKFCCPEKTHDNGKCTNTTKYRYSKAALNSIGEPNPTSSAAEGIHCNTNSDCEDSKQKLWNLLGNIGNYPESWSESDGEPNSINKYVNMYCEKDGGPDDGYCKAECGLFDGKKPVNNNYNVANINFNDVKNPYSFCYYNPNNECKLNPTSFYKKTDAGTPICQKSNFPDAWSRPYGDGYSTLYSGSFPPKCQKDNEKQNACLETMNSFNNVHSINMNDKNCIANLACDQLDVTTWIGTGGSETESFYWTDLNKNESIQEINNSNFRVNQYPNSTPDQTTGLIYRYDPSKNCRGNIPTGYDEESTKSPFDGVSSLAECSPDLANRNKLTMTSDGYWNKLGTDLLYGNPLTSNFQNVNFGNDNEYFRNDNENFGNINSEYDPTKFIGNIDINNPSTAYINGNTTEDKHRYWCSAFQLIGDNNFHDFQKLTKSRNSNPYLKCEDTNEGGVITCVDEQRNSVRCCEDSSQGYSDTVKIKVHKRKTIMNQNDLWSCEGFPAKGKKIFYCDKYYECNNANDCSDVPSTAIKPGCRSTSDIINCGSKCYDTGLILWQNKLKQLPNPVKDDGTEFKFAEYFYSNLTNKSISLGLSGPMPLKFGFNGKQLDDLNNIGYIEGCSLLDGYRMYFNWDQKIKIEMSYSDAVFSFLPPKPEPKPEHGKKYKTLCFSNSQDKPNDVYWFNDSNGVNYSKFKINIIDLVNGNKGFTLTTGNKTLVWATENNPICQCIEHTEAIKNPSERDDKFCNVFAFQYDSSSKLTYIIGLNPERLTLDYNNSDQSPNNLFYDFKSEDIKYQNLILSFSPYPWIKESTQRYYTTGIKMVKYTDLNNKDKTYNLDSYCVLVGYPNTLTWTFKQPMSESTCCAIQIYDN